jgi:hypothetical protein
VITGNTTFEVEIKKLIAAEIERICAILALGVAVADHNEYRFLVGQINALNKVSDSYCIEVYEIISKR